MGRAVRERSKRINNYTYGAVRRIEFVLRVSRKQHVENLEMKCELSTN